MTRLAIIFGGKSIEHELSVKSLSSIMSVIDKEKYEIILIGITKEGKWLRYDGPIEMIENGEWKDYAELKLLGEPEKYDLRVLCSTGSLKSVADVAFPVLHGKYGEDGAIQGLFETMGIPYVGSGITGAALAMDKVLAKSVFRGEYLPVCDWKAFRKEEITDNPAKVMEEVENKFSYPVIVKPSALSASMGVSKVHNAEELKEALNKASEIAGKIMVEEYIDCREIQVGIIGNQVPLASAVGEVNYPGEFFDQEAKLAPETVQRMVPADIPADVADEAKKLAIAAYGALDLSGFARVDFFLEKETNRLLINEVNAIPTFSDNAIFVKLWENVGLEFTELLDRLIGYALEE